MIGLNVGPSSVGSASGSGGQVENRALYILATDTAYLPRATPAAAHEPD